MLYRFFVLTLLFLINAPINCMQDPHGSPSGLRRRKKTHIKILVTQPQENELIHNDEDWYDKRRKKDANDNAMLIACAACGGLPVMTYILRNK